MHPSISGASPPASALTPEKPHLWLERALTPLPRLSRLCVSSRPPVPPPHESRHAVHSRSFSSRRPALPDRAPRLFAGLDPPRRAAYGSRRLTASARSRLRSRPAFARVRQL